jgi:structural maintenance of chromosome 1
MPVSTLEIENFKSYGGKHVIGPFSHHFTSIIGPNGCGKSNLMDAISFVFGINAASLRSSQLRDLIYRNSSDPHPRKLKCIVTLVYKNTNNEDDDEENDDEEENEEIRFTRSILPSGAGEYSVNGVVQSRKEYEAALEQIGVYVQARNFLVFQGDVENLARKNPMEMTSLFETISGSIDYKDEYDAAFQHKEDMEQHQKTIIQQKKVHEYERQQYKIQKQEADTFHNLLQQRNTTMTEYYLWQLYHIYQDKLEKEASAATIAKDVQASTDEEQQIAQELRNAKKDAAVARRATATCEKQRVTQAALCDQYEPTHIQISEEITNLKNKLQQDQKQLEKKIHEASTHDAKVQALVDEIQEYKQTEQDLTKEYEEEKMQLLSQSGNNDGTTVVQLTMEQEEEYATVRELANQASMEPRRILQQQQRQLDLARNSVTSTKEEYDTAVKSVQQIKNDVTNLTERCATMTTVCVCVVCLFSFNRMC